MLRSRRWKVLWAELRYNVVGALGGPRRRSLAKDTEELKAGAKVSQYAEELISIPRAHLRMELRQGHNGVVLTHEGKDVIECILSREGMIAAGFVAQALGTKIPPLGQAAPVRVSTGVLYRAIGVSTLDFDKEESYILLERLLDEAEIQRGGSSDAV